MQCVVRHISSKPRTSGSTEGVGTVAEQPAIRKSHLQICEEKQTLKIHLKMKMKM